MRRTSYTRFLGIYGLEFIPHGEWADAEVRRGRYLINEPTLWDSIEYSYMEALEDGYTTAKSAEEYAVQNPRVVKGLADELIQLIMGA